VNVTFFNLNNKTSPFYCGFAIFLNPRRCFARTIKFPSEVLPGYVLCTTELLVQPYFMGSQKNKLKQESSSMGEVSLVENEYL
jgi:hypothetical protein